MGEQRAGGTDGSLVDQAWRAFDAAAADWLLGVIGDESLVEAAIAALASGCDSSSLAQLASVRGHDQGKILTAVFGAFKERNLEFPLSEDAVNLSLRDVLVRMLAESITPEEASVKLWRLAVKDQGPCPNDWLPEFKDLAISLNLYEDPHCDFELDVDQWREEMLALAREALARNLGERDDWSEDAE